MSTITITHHGKPIATRRYANGPTRLAYTHGTLRIELLWRAR